MNEKPFYMQPKFAVPVALIALVLVFVLSAVSKSNEEITLRNRFEAQTSNLQVVYDNTWKTISQTAQVTEEYKNSFAKIYPDLMKGRYGNARGGALLSFVQESNPNFDTRLFERLADQIEVQRARFTREQQVAIDLKREHDNLRTTFPASWIVGSRAPLVLHLVTSSKTEKTFETGKDDDTSVFGK